MTDLERARLAALEEKYRGLQGDMPPWGDVIFLLRMLAAARREGAEAEARARDEIVALRKRGARVMTDDTIELVAQELIDVGIPDMPLALAIAKVAIAAISRAEP